MMNQKKIFDEIISNVIIVDKNSREILLEKHNIFTNLGKRFIRQLVTGDLVLEEISGHPKYVVEIGNPTVATEPVYTDVDINNHNPNINISITTHLTSDMGTEFEAQFVFDYLNNTGSSIIFKEMGLFYRPEGVGSDYPEPTANTAGTGTVDVSSSTTTISFSSSQTGLENKWIKVDTGSYNEWRKILSGSGQSWVVNSVFRNTVSGLSFSIAESDENLMLARLRTSYNQITIANSREIEITWKILF